MPELACAILKIDNDKRVVYGWASVVKRDGEPVTDYQGDIIPPDEIEKAAHAYVQNFRVGKEKHSGDQVASLVESFVVNPASFGALMKSMGLPAPNPLPIEGWWVGYKVSDDNVWKRIKSGELKGFSIGGSGKRTPLPN